MKGKIITLMLVILASLTVVSCTKKETASNESDAVTSASIVVDGEALVKGLAKDGVWIVATLNDIEVKKDIIVEGEFTNRDVLDRKLALYTQDENRKITAQFMLTAPKLIVKSPNFRITGGTFKGDVYVEAEGFKLDKSSTVEGNIYFKTQELMDTFVMDETATFNGIKEVK